MDQSAGVGHLPVGAPVVAANGERLGTVRAAYPHFIMVAEEGSANDFEVPSHAIANFDGRRVQLTINREALTELDDEGIAARRLHLDGP